MISNIKFIKSVVEEIKQLEKTALNTPKLVEPTIVHLDSGFRINLDNKGHYISISPFLGQIYFRSKLPIRNDARTSQIDSLMFEDQEAAHKLYEKILAELNAA